ncbi:SDR family NAD(P)-dependent oxidoreductase [Corallococcus sp. ZKHCc1 1396]|uniref:SDR family NAD(P)-dependent oxidoreductase n=1 Tax=Corallococcus soli TaxID=2710757 RepID=A0ABR9PX84_9BACT|nr:type I polyketide synthase [Corallococcus soli]MBE4752362.1 SDR family NAD(P)-dependent oxidoreductase [Corallococcus soli]
MSGTGGQEGLEGIAVVGMAGRFPGAADVDTFWKNLRDGVESIRFYSEAELLDAGVSPELLADPAYVRANAALEGVELFDAGFFGMNPGVAQITDPQQRVFLEVAWHALEHAGYDAERFSGDIGVFGGLSINTYLLENLAGNRQLIESHGLLQAAIANRGDHLATLTAYKLNLRGPAFTVQSTCSTALSAVHLACQALLSYQTDMALAGGVAVRVPQTMGYLFQEGGVASPDGHCRPFDAQAKGTVFGSGAGAVVLKRLEDAIAAGDTIHAVIRGSAANNDGASKIGYTAPSPEGQRRAISMALAVAGVSPETVGYVECHGTGTVLGDPIEVEALTQAFGAKTQRRQFCALGSVKSNIGHLDTAAGIAGLIKTVLCLKHQQLPPTLHFESPNPAIDLQKSPFYVNARLSDWARPATHPRRAGVSSFGIGGTNVHLVLEEAPPVQAARASDGWHTLVLSARTASALEARTDELRRHLEAHPELDLADVAFTLQQGRRPFEVRRALTCRSVADAVETLERLPPERTWTGKVEGHARSVAFLFPGVGSQHPGMARELAEALPVFREHLDTSLKALDAALGMDLRPLLFPRPGAEAAATEALSHTHVAEPALFAVEYALAATWKAWGVQPRAVLGEGIGEYTAACVAGVVSFADAVTLVALRSRLVKRLPEGAMTLVMLPEQELAALLPPHGLSLAWVGRPSVGTVSGPKAGIEALEAGLRQRGVAFRRLLGDRALQSPDVDGISAELGTAVRRVSFQAPTIPFFSGVHAGWVTGTEVAEASWWASQLRRTLRLSPGIEALFQEPDRLLLEVGPGRTWLNIARLHPAKSPRQTVLGSLAQDVKEASEPRAMLAALARLWMSGAPVDWEGVHAGASRRRVPLPQYPFERQRLWLDPTPRTPTRAVTEEPLPPRRVDPADWFFVPSWKRTAPPVPASREPERVLLFVDAFGLGELLASRLEQRGHTVLRVERGVSGASGASAPSAGRYTLDPRSPGDYRRLLQELKDQGRSPARIVHLWSVDPQRSAGSRLDVLPRVEEAGFRSLMYLAQAVGAVYATTPVELQVLASQLFSVSGEETLCPEKATLLGPCLVIGQEYPNVRCRLIDVPLSTPGSTGEAGLVGHLLAEVESRAADAVTAWRGRHRWVRTHESVRLEAPEGRVPRLRPGGVYLITGGLGGIGLVLAQDVAKMAGGARLVLLGRQPLPERATWSALLESQPQSPHANVIRAIRDLERGGSEVMTVAADVTDRARMAEALADVRARFGAVHGLIHAAGVPAGGALQLKTDEIAQRVFAPKVRGTLVLDALLEGQPLDFVIHCASRTSVLGGFGQADYVAANAFLDAWAHHKSLTSSTFTVAVDWCSWRDVGMLANAAGAKAALPVRTPAVAISGAPVELGHPLLSRRMPSAPGTEVYETVLRVDTHWVLDDHRILGNPVIAGTTYLEMVRAAFAQRTERQDLEISDVYFLTPLSVRVGDQRVARLELTDEGADGFSFHVSSRSAEGADLIRHVMGRARPLASTPAPQHDLAALTAGCPTVKVFTDDDSHDEDHGPRWQCVRQVRWGEQQVLATLELPAEFASDLDVMKLHPSLLDKSIGTGRDFILGAVPYMPYSYQRLVFRHPFTRRIHVHTRSHGEGSNRSETPAFDLRIMDDTGRELVEITRFALKRVNDVGAMYKNLASRDAAPAAAVVRAPAAAPASAPAENVFQQILRQEAISPEEGVDLLRRVLASAELPQVVVSTRDLNALLARGLIHTSPSKAAEEEVEAEASTDASSQAIRRPRPELPIPFQAPETKLQEQLGDILKEVLAVDRVGLRDNFFDLGGDSVMAIQIVSRIKKRLGREIAVVQLFEAPTLSALATLLGGAAGGLEDATSAQTEAATPAGEDSASRGARRRARAIARRGPEGE